MRNDESRLQRACVTWFRLQYPRYKRLLFAVPNGGARSAVTGAILKAEGVVPGVADLILFLPRGGRHALCIEMKTERGRQSERQREWQEAVEREGYEYALCRSLDDFARVVRCYINGSVST